MAEPLPINVEPARHRQKYEGFTITVVYDLQTMKWKWVASRPVTTDIRYEGVASTPGDAFGAAKRRIDGR